MGFIYLFYNLVALTVTLEVMLSQEMKNKEGMEGGSAEGLRESLIQKKEPFLLQR